MMMVWFGLADIQTKLAGLGLADSMQEGEEENRTVSNRYRVGVGVGLDHSYFF